MLIKLASVRDCQTLEQAVLQAQDAGRKYVHVASRILNPKCAPVKPQATEPAK
jgi:PTS system mannose-specific IIA component